MMDRPFLKTLFHTFETDLLPWPEDGERVLVVNAPADFRAPAGLGTNLDIAQDFRPAFLALSRAGFQAAPAPEGRDYDLVLVLLGRHRGANEAMIADAAARARPGGRVVAAGGKLEGAASMARRLSTRIATLAQLSKHHGVAFWFAVETGTAAVLVGTDAHEAKPLDEGYRTAPGMFSHGRPDPGSVLLLESLPGDISGTVADFGAGWGYIASSLTERFSGLSALDLYEASHAALEAARINLAQKVTAFPVGYFWRDLRTEEAERSYDCVVMNPPFHEGRSAEPEIGADFIRAAARALKRGGRLFLVANRGLPYEKVLAAEFARSGEIVRDGRYKILLGER